MHSALRRAEMPLSRGSAADRTTEAMKITRMKKLVVLAGTVTTVAALAGTGTASPSAHQTRVAKKPITSGFYRGRAIGYYDFGPIALKPGNKLAPIWTVTNGAQGQ